MPYDWKSPYSRRLAKAASARGKRMARARWARDRERRDKLAALTAEQCPSKIVRRVVVIENESTVKEAVIFSFDSRRSAAAKLRKVLRTPVTQD